MLNKVDSVKSNNSFTARKNLSPADKFLSDVDKIVDHNKNGDFFARNCWSSTAIYPVGIGILGYELYNSHKISKLEKAQHLLQADALKKSFKKKFSLLLAASIAVIGGLQYLFNKNSDKKYQKIKAFFDEVNTQTCAKLDDETFRSSLKAAVFNPISGTISINRNQINDPLTNSKCKKLIKHELVHAKQFETIARMDDGIEKLNYACLKRMSKFAQNPTVKKEFIEIYNDIQSNPLKYKGKTVNVDGANVDFNDYITSMYTLLTNKNATFKDIPIVINRDYYESVREKKGPLSPEENDKALQYYQANIDYPSLSTFQCLNPFSKYYSNILENEAYKENPNIMTFIRKVCGKD